MFEFQTRSTTTAFLPAAKESRRELRCVVPRPIDFRHALFRARVGKHSGGGGLCNKDKSELLARGMVRDVNLQARC